MQYTCTTSQQSDSPWKLRVVGIFQTVLKAAIAGTILEDGRSARRGFIYFPPSSRSSQKAMGVGF